MKLFRRTDLIIIASLLVIAGIIFLSLRRSGSATSARLTFQPESGRTEQLLNLRENRRLDLISNGIPIHIEVKDGQARFTESECPDHICENCGWLSAEGESAVCLPARAMLIIEE